MTLKARAATQARLHVIAWECPVCKTHVEEVVSLDELGELACGGGIEDRCPACGSDVDLMGLDELKPWPTLPEGWDCRYRFKSTKGA